MNNAPIFIIGTERSGSNLLRLVLNSHSNIAIPHPPHILKYFGNIEHKYKDFEVLTRDILRLVKVHIHPWDIEPSFERIVEKANPRDSIGVMWEIYDQFLEYSGKKRWGCKSTFVIDYTDRVLKKDPESKFVLLLRDPRDVALSSKKSVFSTFHPWLTARLWEQNQKTGLELLKKCGTNTIFVLRYEDLISKPEFEIKKLCNFLCEPFEEQMLSFHHTKDAQSCSQLSESWKNTSQPILTNNSNKYLTELSPQEIQLVETVTRSLMQHFGYEPKFKCDLNPSQIDKTVYYGQELILKTKVEIRSLKKDKNHWRRWARKALITYINKKHFERAL